MTAPRSVAVEATACALCGGTAATPIASGRDYEYYSSPDTFTFVQCAGCAHVFLNPRPTTQTASVIYPSNYYTVSGVHQSAFLSVLGRIKDRILIHRLANVLASLPFSGQVLEIGTGDGSLLVALRRARPGLRLCGVDLRFTPARVKALEAIGIECIEGLVEDCTLPSGCDLVIMNQVVEHLWNLDAGLRKVSGAMRVGGLVSIATPNLHGYDRRWFSRTAWGGYHFPRHLNLFTPESLGRLLARYGLRAVSHANLAAPLVWLATSQNIAGTFGVRGRWLLTESNLPLLAAFTAVDLFMSGLGRSTSNQQLVAIRE
jgi:2-polyprenyl-3-methyl-5-hydroxy-6-metoxy-1,4-benzoquinol methylase